MPRAASVATLACVALLAHMTRFIAGASMIGASVAMHRVQSRSSARPAASRAIRSALAGAMSYDLRPTRELDVPHGGFRGAVP